MFLLIVRNTSKLQIVWPGIVSYMCFNLGKSKSELEQSEILYLKLCLCEANFE